MGQLTFQATLGGAVNLVGPNTASTTSFTLPSADGTSGQALITNGSGTLSFGSPSAATPSVLGTVYGKQSTASYLTSIGYNAASSVTGSFNSAFGQLALFSLTSGASNTAIGDETLYTIVTGSDNVAVGASSLYYATGSNNTTVGTGSMFNTTTGDSNTAVGHYAMRANTTGSNNAATGRYALTSNTTGATNTAVGHQALYSNSTGSNLTGVGAYALNACTTGGNVGVGAYSLYNLTTGTGNIAMGTYDTGGSPPAGMSITTGSYNLCMGLAAGNGLTTGSYNTYLGYAPSPSSASVIGETVLGYGTGKGANTAFINPSSITTGVYNGNNSTLWAITSDARLKKNIINNDVGLEKLTQIQVRNFEYRLPEEITEVPKEQAIQKSGVQLGVIAQELQAILPECVKTESTGVMTVDADNLTWYMINAIKELKAEIDQLKGNV
jgi:hypothetical protein